MLEPSAGLVPATISKSLAGKPIASRGDFAIAISGGGSDAPVASLGLVAAVDKKVTVLVEPVFGQSPPLPLVCQPTLLQIDARTARGTSGGGIFNLKGELIGMTTALAAIAGSDLAPGFAVPMDRLYRPIIATLQAGQEVEYGFLGVTWASDQRGNQRGWPQMNRFPARSNGNGVEIGMVTPGMPAEVAGIRSGDTLLEVNGFPVSDMNDLQFRVGSALATGETQLAMRRGDGPVKTVSVKLAKANNRLPWFASQRPQPVFGLRVDHLSTLFQDLVLNESRLDQEWMSSLPQAGVVVSEIEKGSPAEAAFSLPNQKYVITKVNGQSIANPAEFYTRTWKATRLALTILPVGKSSKPYEVTLP